MNPSTLMLIRQKVVDVEQLLLKLQALRQEGRSIVFTNGCFDILHPGHIHTLSQAADEGEVLVVGLNSDASVSRLKGPERPVNTVSDRAMMLAALQFVDFVVAFEEDTPYSLIKAIEPDVLLKGGDYKEDEIVGADVVKEKGGKVVVAQLVPGKSTTGMIQKMGKTRNTGKSEER